MWPELQRWRGIVLIAVAVVATVWLAVGNQLVLYIHPRYIVFTVVMAVLAIGFVVAAVVGRPHHDPVDEGRGRARLVTRSALAIAGVAAVAMLALPPATLTSATASQRDINSTTVGAQARSVESAASGSDSAFAAYTVLDWQSLLRQTSDLAFYDSKPVDVIGFITPDEDDPQNVFYVSRFVVTCCAVDAQPTGIPVYQQNWADTFSVDEWVRVTGEFTTNPSAQSRQSIALSPTTIDIVEQPSEPYLF